MKFPRPGILTFVLVYQKMKYDNSNVVQIFFSYLNKKAEIGTTGWQQATYQFTMVGTPVVVHAPQFEKLCFRLIKISMCKVLRGNQDSTVHTATCYRLDGLRFKPRWKQEFSLYICPNWTWGPAASSITGIGTLYQQ